MDDSRGTIIFKASVEYNGKFIEEVGKMPEIVLGYKHESKRVLFEQLEKLQNKLNKRFIEEIINPYQKNADSSNK